MRLAAIAFVAGAWGLQQQADLPASWWLGAGAIAAMAMLAIAGWFQRRADPSLHPLPFKGRVRVGMGSISVSNAPPNSRQRAFAAVLTPLACLILGFVWAAWRADLRLNDEFPSAMEGRDVVVVGTVDELPYFFDRGVRFSLRVETAVEPNVASGGSPSPGGNSPAQTRAQVPSRIALSWYSSGSAGAAGPSLANIEPGERWRLTVRLKKPHGNANPDGFDYEYWLLEQGLRATGAVRPSSNDPALVDRRLDAFVWNINDAVERMRSLLRSRIVQALPDSPYAPVIVALVVGDQRGIGQSDWQVYNRTGIGHLISISGLHITMIAGLAATLVFALWRRSPRLAVRLPAHKAAALAGALVALLYCLLAGFGVPAQRTLYMLGMVALALWMGRISSASRVLCAALLIVVVLDPWAVMSAGFWLSFGAVAAIFYVTVGRVEERLPRPARWQDKVRLIVKQGARIQWAVTLGLTPLTMLLFHQVSIISPIANAIAIPLVSLVVTPLALLGALLAAPAFFVTNLIANLLLHAAHGLIAGLAALLGWMSAKPIAVWTGAAPSWWAFACAMVGVAWCLAPRGLPLRWLGLAWLVPLFAWPPDRPEAGTLRLTALDIGQGMAVLVETPRQTTLYDTGPQYGFQAAARDTPDDGNNAGNRTVVPYLRAQGIDRLALLVVSHNDSDHSGGARAILGQIPVARVMSSLAEESAIVATAGPRHTRCLVGQRWAADGASFEMLHPTSTVYQLPGIKPNAKSCVLRIRIGGQSVMLAGDIERPQESELIARAGAEGSVADATGDPHDALKADVLLVPHHGSMTSSSEPFLDAVQPKLALVQAGYRNRYGHPKAEVLKRYAARGVRIERNDDDGAITVVLDGKQMTVEAYRQTHRRYWYGR